MTESPTLSHSVFPCRFRGLTQAIIVRIGLEVLLFQLQTCIINLTREIFLHFSGENRFSGLLMLATLNVKWKFGIKICCWNKSNCKLTNPNDLAWCESESSRRRHVACHAVPVCSRYAHHAIRNAHSSDLFGWKVYVSACKRAFQSSKLLCARTAQRFLPLVSGSTYKTQDNWKHVES